MNDFSPLASSPTSTGGAGPDLGGIYPKTGHPYYIVAPPYARTSAGIRVLHLLCHSLNRRGHVAHMIIHPAFPWREDYLAPDLMAPLLTIATRDRHFNNGPAPILVYPEVVSGNPFNSPCVVRYVLNFPGLLGGDATYPEEELCFGFSEILASHTSHPGNILFMPVIDTSVFRPPERQQPRQGTCFYAHKYKHMHGGALFDITRDSLEITNGFTDSPSPHQIAEVFHRSELFYAYENTSLATEAVLCGCPTVLLPNPHLTQSIGLKELGVDGYAWGADPSEVARAKATVAQGAANYMARFPLYWAALDQFIALTQQHAKSRPYSQPINLAEGCDTKGESEARAAFAEQRLSRFVGLFNQYAHDLTQI